MAERRVPTRAVDLWRFLECESLTLAEWAASFNAEVKASGGGPHHLLGYSMGGRLALHALLDAPELWAQATIVSAHPGLTDEGERLQRMARDAEWAGLALTADWPQFLDKWQNQSVLRSTIEPGPRGQLVNRRRAIARSFMEWSLGKQADLRPGLTNLQTPILWLTGRDDEKFTRLAADLVPTLRQGRHHIVPDCGHRLPWEAEDVLADLVGQEISGTSPTTD